MRRREFIAVLSGAAALPLSVHAQGRRKLPVLGFVGPTTASIAVERIAAFTKRLRELGWIDGQTLLIKFGWANGKTERFGEIAAEFVRENVDIIVTWGTETAIAVKQQTSRIPIVFTVVGDPVGSGLVGSLARPGGNVTGLSTQNDDAAGKRLEFLRQVVPDLRQLAIMTNISNLGGVLETKQVEASARSLGVQLIKLKIHKPEDISAAFVTMKGRVQALYVVADALFNTARNVIGALALQARLPTMNGFRAAVAAGGLMSYSPDFLDLFRRTAELVDKILRGTKPSDIPVEQPTSFDLVINLKTAKMLGVDVPPTLLALADEVIQ